MQQVPPGSGRWTQRNWEEPPVTINPNKLWLCSSSSHSLMSYMLRFYCSVFTFLTVIIQIESVDFFKKHFHYLHFIFYWFKEILISWSFSCLIDLTMKLHPVRFNKISFIIFILFNFSFDRGDMSSVLRLAAPLVHPGERSHFLLWQWGGRW